MNKTKSLLNRVSWNGLDYFRTMIPELYQVDDTKCKTVKSPLREDRNPSFSVFQNQRTGIWMYNDFGTGQKGDMFDLAAELHGIDIKNQFSVLLQRMADDLGVDEMTDEDLEKVLNPVWNEPFRIDLPGLTRNRKNKIISFRRKAIRSDNVEVRFDIHEVSFSDLATRHERWMNEYGITKEAMTLNNACFITGYVVYSNEQPKKVLLPDNEVWLAYRVGKCAKIYCTAPKKFFYLGTKPKGYSFGTNQPFEKEQIVLLVGGEKDVLTAKSHGFEAICLNSETQMPARSFLHDCYFTKGYKLVTLFDLDQTGMEQAKRINVECGLPYVTLPTWVSERGGKDVADYFKLGGSVGELNQLIEAAVGIIPSNAGQMVDEAVVPIGNEEPQGKRLSVRTAQQRIADAANQPEILPHADVLWQKNELVILFGDTGKGKSIAAVAIADAISKGESFLGLENKLPAMRVLYYDFELSDKQFQKRYSNEAGEPYEFSPGLFIDNVDLSQIADTDKKVKFEEVLLDRFKSDILDTHAEVVIIDNITFLSTHTPEDSQVALTLMKLLKELKTSMDISVLVLAHTPKKVGTFGITIQDLAGSKHLSNFADGVIALGDVKSKKNVRYLMQVKPSRSGEHKFDKSNVILCELEKEDKFLTFRFIKFCQEYELMGPAEENGKDEKVAMMKEMQRQGKTVREISVEIGISKSSVSRWLNEAK